MPSAADLGRKYELDSIHTFSELEADNERLAFGGEYESPDILRAMADGKDVDMESFLACKRERQSVGRDKISRDFGMDGLSVCDRAWKSGSLEEVRNSLRIIEAKSAPADCHSLGPVIARHFQSLTAQKTPIPVDLLSPFSPLPSVYHSYQHAPHLLTWKKIDMQPMEDTVTTIARPGIVLRDWQRRAARRIRRALRRKSVCVLPAMMGSGKTFALLDVLKNCSKFPLRIFCAHTINNGSQTIKSAAEFGIDMIDLTCAGARFPAGSDKEANHLVSSVLRLYTESTVHNPSYCVICHHTLRFLAPRLLELQYKVVLAVDEFHKVTSSKPILLSLLHENTKTKTVFASATPTRDWNVRNMRVPADPKREREEEEGEREERLAWNAVQQRMQCETNHPPFVYGMKDGKDDKYLVDIHIECVIGQEPGDQDEYDSGHASIDQQVKVVAGWIYSNNFATTSIYASRIDEANRVSEKLEAELASLSGTNPWCRPVHSELTASEHEATLDEFKSKTFSDKCFHKVVVSVGQLKEGFDMPHLSAAIILHPPENEGSMFQMAGRTMRAYPGKSKGRVLVFGKEAATRSVARMLASYDKTWSATSVGCILSGGYRCQMKAGMDPEVRKEMIKEAKKMKERMREAMHKRLVVIDPEGYWKAKIEAMNNFMEEHGIPVQREKKMLIIQFEGMVNELEAYHFYKGIRTAWFKEDGQYSTSEEDKQALGSGNVWKNPILLGEGEKKEAYTRELERYYNENEKAPPRGLTTIIQLGEEENHKCSLENFNMKVRRNMGKEGNSFYHTTREVAERLSLLPGWVNYEERKKKMMEEAIEYMEENKKLPRKRTRLGAFVCHVKRFWNKTGNGMHHTTEEEKDRYRAFSFWTDPVPR